MQSSARRAGEEDSVELEEKRTVKLGTEMAFRCESQPAKKNITKRPPFAPEK